MVSPSVLIASCKVASNATTHKLKGNYKALYSDDDISQALVDYYFDPSHEATGIENWCKENTVVPKSTFNNHWKKSSLGKYNGDSVSKVQNLINVYINCLKKTKKERGKAGAAAS